MTAPLYPWRREQTLVLASLLILAGAAWALLVWEARTAQDEMTGLTMGMSAPVFLATWAVMMVAMMFPTAAPMIMFFSRIQAGRAERGQSFVPTVVFITPYLAVWILFGAVGYAVAAVVTEVGHESAWLMDNGARIVGGLLILTGFYQLTPLKNVCLSKCRSPLAFLLTSWRDGYAGAVRMGLQHATYCVGCCWLLFVLLFPIGMMNVVAMAILTAFIFAEKALPKRILIGRGAALLLIAWGALVMAVPDAWSAGSRAAAM